MKKSICIIVLLMCCVVSHGYVFSHLTVENGLSNNTVNSISQDGNGRMWFATHCGVSRFDGYDFTTFKYSPSDPHTIQSNYVNSVHSDRNGDMWICSADGLSKYDSRSGRFDRIEIPGLRSVEELVQIDDSHYIIGTRNVTLIYDSRSGSIREFQREGKALRIYSAFEDSGTFVFGTSSRELIRYTFDSEGNPEPVGVALELGRHSAGSILPAGSGSYWIGTNGSGIFKADFNSGTVEKINLPSLPSERIESVSLDARDRLWIVTKKGICVFDPADGTDFYLGHDIYDPSSLSSSVLRSVFMDSDGNLWFGSSYDGVDFLNANQSPFMTLRSHPGKNGLSDAVVKSLCVDLDNSVWIGARSGGLDHFNPVTGVVDAIPDVPHPLSIYCPSDNPGKVYAGTYHDGIYEVDKSTMKARKITPSRDINDMVAANGNCFWVASLAGLFICNPDKQTLKKVRLGDELMRVIDLMVDRQGRLWVGSKERLHVYEVSPTNRLTEVTEPTLADIIRPQCIYESSDGTVWIGTSDGLKYFSKGILSDAFTKYGTINQSIQCIETDELGWMWISTNNGLLRFNHKTGDLTSYYASDGLQSSAYISHSSGRAADGTLYFGGPRGVSYFNPETVQDNFTTHKPIITGLSVHNMPVVPGDGSKILDNDISHTSKIVLKHRQDAFTLSFSCPNYSSEGHDTFYYKLDGFDHDWILSRNREATYTNLSKGNYTFRVKVLNRNNVPAEDEAALSIRVKPAWYASTLMELLFLLVAVSATLYGISTLLKRRDMKNREEMEGMRQRYEEKLINAKLSAYYPSGARLSAEEERFLSSVIRNIESKIQNNAYSIEALASDMCMSRSNLHLKLKSITGSSPIELMMRIRIEKACELIREGNHSISEVAERTGFSSPSYFSTCFKKATGKSPSEYAQEA